MRPLVSLPDETILMLLNKVRRDLTFHLIILNAKVFLQESRAAPSQASLMLSKVHVCIHNSIRTLSMDQCSQNSKRDVSVGFQWPFVPLKGTLTYRPLTKPFCILSSFISQILDLIYSGFHKNFQNSFHFVNTSFFL